MNPYTSPRSPASRRCPSPWRFFFCSALFYPLWFVVGGAISIGGSEREAMVEGRLSEWWQSLRARNVDSGIRFESALGSDPVVPLDLFDSVAENLLENARSKRLNEPGIHIRVQLEARNGAAHLRVSDDGSCIDTDTARNLFKSPVNSRNGLGIGLYQAARQAQQWGYELSLTANRPHEVAFDLRPA